MSDNESSSSKTTRDVHIVRTIIAGLNIRIVYFKLCNIAGPIYNLAS
jgi:hypothetical protein